MDRNEEIRSLSSERPFFSDVLNFDLEERKDLIEKHKSELKYICKLVDHFIKDVAHIIVNRMPTSMIANLTYNLTQNLASCYVGLTVYDYLKTAYLIDEDYDASYEMWNDFSQCARKIEKMISNLIDENIYNIGEPSNCENLRPLVASEKRVPLSLLNLQHTLSKMNGDSIFVSLLDYIRGIETRLEIIKTGIHNLTDEDFETIYNANYVLYLENYWPNEGKNFRYHIEEHYFRGRVSKIDTLERLLRDEQYDFERNITGALWRDYFHDKKTLYFEMRRVKLDEKQWKYFFKEICRFEEYVKWIEELKNPPESEEDKQKRELLLRSNKIFNLKPAKLKKEVDILFLYQYINTRFISEKMHVYDWYALYYILDKNGLLLPCTVEDFVRQMNHDEWFAHVETKCSANEINTYRFLKDKSPNNWSDRFKPTGSRASKNSVANLYRKYSDLEETIDEIYVIE